MNMESHQAPIAENTPDPIPQTYADLINEAFIAPIRNVAVIDDEYPTLSAFLNDELSQEQKNDINIARLKQIISMCHSKHKWSVDVYDGRKPKLGDPQDDHSEHINHSDLIILDYHLDGDPANDDGNRARNIIKHLSKNNHFNLVVIHTKGHADDIKAVFEEILKDFIRLENFNIFIENDIQEQIDEFLDTNDPDQTNFPSFYNKYSLIDLAQSFFHQGYNIDDENHIFRGAIDDIEKIAKGANVATEFIVNYKAFQLLKEILPTKKETEYTTTQWDFTKEVNYISSGRVFLTVILKHKEESEDSIYDNLQKALRCHDASPMMLLMTKMRNEIDDRGLEFANQIIENRLAQAGWLYNLLHKAAQDPAEHDHAINLHWEQLYSASRDSLIDFSKRLTLSLKQDGTSNKNIIERYFKDCIGNATDSILHLNNYSCSRVPTTSHLTTGTILKCEKGKYWICLTPACDLVPEQGSKRWQDRLGDDHIAFQTIQLVEDTARLDKSLKKVHENELVFLKIENEIKLFKFSNGNPLWETFYASNRGIFSTENEGNKFINAKTFRLYEGQVQAVEYKMNVISELRYEYALNLLHKFGSNQTRVGLGFVNQLW